MEPVTNWSSLPLLSSSNDSTACQNHFTMLLSATQCFSRVLAFQSFRSIFPSPPMISCTHKALSGTVKRVGLRRALFGSLESWGLFFFFCIEKDIQMILSTSSSLWSKGLSRCCGMSSLKPFCRARNWASMPRMNLQFT